MAVKREAISKKKRFEILKRDKFMCRYCGAKAPEVLLHIEHIIPVSKKGTNDYENLIAACESCNSGKGARLLTDQTAIEKSRDLIAKSQAEIEQLEEMMRWRKTVQNKKAKQKEWVLSSLEDIANTSLSEYGQQNVWDAFKKHDFEDCADHIASYLQECERRYEAEQKVFTFTQYITFQKKRDTLEGKIRYFLGIVRNKCSFNILNSVSAWTRDADISEGFIEQLITDIKKHQYFSDDGFIDWWHEWVRLEFGACCDFHTGEAITEVFGNE